MSAPNERNGVNDHPDRRHITEKDISELQSLLSSTKAEIRTPSSTNYEESIKRWSRNAEKPAGVAIVPTSAEEISIILRYATSQYLDIAVKSGGHSTAGVISTDGGLLIDLGGMRHVNVDPERKLLYVQGRCLWADVDDAAWEHGLACVGGTAADTGVGGLTLGGGYGVLSSAHGLVIDNLVEVTIVLANGEIKKASEKENEDPFWALRGAGQNFGVCTEFVFKALPREICGLGPDGKKYTKSGGKAMSLLGLTRPPPANGNVMILTAHAFDGPEAEGKQLLKPFYDIGPAMDTMEMKPYPAVNRLLAPPIGLRVSMKGAAYVMPIQASFVQEVLQKYTDFTARNEDAKETLLMWELFDSVEVEKRDAGSFANRGHQLNALVAPMWRDPANDTSFRQWAREMSGMFKIELESQGEKTGQGVDGGVGIRGDKGAVLLYGNYDQYDERSKDIFGSNYDPLQSLKAEFDPGNVFNKLFPVTPAAA
ncbi:FAD binding domain-containing protein [Delphinella strobiligena]|nr:FAD binding domain-containing protein [Delphinella strobiligena]